MKKLTLMILSLLLAGGAMHSLANESTATKNAPAGTKIEMGVGHFNRDGKPFHYWDKAKEIPLNCARCHGAESLPQYLKEGKNTAAPLVKNAFACTNCHSDMLTYERHKVDKVTFPGGVVADGGNNDTNLCITCHQGRESTAGVNKAIADKPLDTPDPKLAFMHVHYYPAGATMLGTQAKVAYEYTGKTYAGRYNHPYNHPRIMNSCTDCHEAHSGKVKVEKCATCHEDAGGIPKQTTRELKQNMAALYAGIQQYARNVGDAALAYTPDASPYWYTDTNGNGKVDPDEMKPANSYKAYTPRLLQAVYNYTFLLRDPGAAHHNGKYAGQIVYDSLESLAASGKAGVDMKGKNRP